MRRRMRILLVILAATIVLVAVYFEPSHCVRGWLWGEAFFEGRPTSYWRALIENEIAEDPDLFNEIWGSRKPSFWESVRQRCGLETTRQRSYVLIMHTGGEAVLAELSHDRSPRVRAFAEHVIDYNTNELPRVAKMEPPFGMDILVVMPWHHALCKARDVRENE
jgi:hypothetical protein